MEQLLVIVLKPFLYRLVRAGFRRGVGSARTAVDGRLGGGMEAPGDLPGGARHNGLPLRD